MRTLIASISIIALLLLTWGVFIHFAEENLHELIDIIGNDIEVHIYDDNWEKASVGIDKLTKTWEEQKKVYRFFFSTLDINNVNYSIIRIKSHIATNNVSLSLSELAYLKGQLDSLHSNELITLDNLL